MGLIKKNADLSKLDTLVGKGTTFEGALTSTESICVEGNVKGKVVSEGSVVIGENGVVEADVIADVVLLGGEVHGNIIAKTKLEITTSGKLRGDIKTGSLVIAEGVMFEGKCQMISDDNDIQRESKQNHIETPLLEKH